MAEKGGIRQKWWETVCVKEMEINPRCERQMRDFELSL